MWRRQKRGEASSSKDKGKYKARDKGNIDSYDILFHDKDHKTYFNTLSRHKIIST